MKTLSNILVLVATASDTAALHVELITATNEKHDSFQDISCNISWSFKSVSLVD